MSYCVNCGVELHQTASRCVLCNIEINNPLAEIDNDAETPFPLEREVMEPVSYRELILLLSILLVSPSAVCAFLNIAIYNETFWSAYVIFACIAVWIFAVLPLWLRGMSIVSYIAFDAIAVFMYVGAVAMQFQDREWFFQLAVPIITMLAILLIFVFSFWSKFKTSILITASICLISVGIFIVGLEIFIDLFLNQVLSLTWSLMVISCCIAIATPALIISRNKKLRNEVRRRLHL